MFGLLNSSRIHGLHNESVNDDNQRSTNPVTATTNNKNIRQRSKLARNGSGSGPRVLGDVSLTHQLHGIKVPVNFIEKLIKTELLTGYEALKHFKNFRHSTRHHYRQPLHHTGNNLKSIDYGNLHGNYLSDIPDDTKSRLQREMTIIKYPNDTQYQHQHQHQTPRVEMEVIDSTTDISSSILRYNVDSCFVQREVFPPIGNTNEMISDQSIKSDLSLSSCSDSPATERKTSNSPTPTNYPKGIQRRKLMQMVTFLDQQNQRLQKELAKEKRRRTEELSRIIKSLICTESKLKLDKKQINQRLLEKDTEICRLVSLNRTLRKQNNGKHIDSDKTSKTTEECLTPEALQCMSCRNKFYAIDTKENWTQTTKDGRKSNDDPTTEIGSSSDDTVSSSFYGARRSVRYTSKRTFGTFRDYMRSRSMNIDDPNLDNSEENTSTISRDESQNSYEKMNIYSRTIDRLHGVRRVSSFEGDLDSEYDNINSRKVQSPGHLEEDDFFSPAEDEQMLSTTVEKIEYSPCSSKSNSLSRSKDLSEASPKHEFETSTDDWYASASDGEEESESVRTISYGYNVAVNPVLECVNQILLQQSMEESNNDSQPTSLEGNDTPNICSSQHSDRQSLNSSNSSTKDQAGNTGTISRKRVHFSTKNSMVHVPRDDDDHDNSIPLALSSPSASVIAEQIKDNILNYESIYSNEYEPIGSENNSCNLYVDMEAKLSPEARKNIENKPPKQPPALPPKPANLIKFKKAQKINALPAPVHFNGFDSCDTADDNLTASEPDYCSISEVNVAINSVQVVVDVHKEPHFTPALEVESLKNDNHSLKTDEIEEIFADIPKLPNVAAIIAPKTPPSKLNYTLKAHEIQGISNIQQSPRQFKRKHVPNILAEINKRMINLNQTTPTKNSNHFSNGIHSMSTPPKKLQVPLGKPPALPTSSPVIEEKHLPLQAEFDWYNLDVEYGKSPSNQPDIIKASDINSIVENEDELIGLHGVEYNLDEEFSLASNNQPDIIKENFNESPKTVNDAALPQTTVCEEFPIITEVTPCLKKIKTTASFDKFIDSSGLSTKPLPRQRKIYFAGPFV